MSSELPDEIQRMIELSEKSVSQADAHADQSGAMMAQMLQAVGVGGSLEYARVPWDEVNKLAAEGWRLTEQSPYRDRWVMSRPRQISDADLAALTAGLPGR